MNYSYLLTALLLLPIWLLVFYRRPDLRRPLWIMSLIMAFYETLPFLSTFYGLEAGGTLKQSRGHVSE